MKFPDSCVILVAKQEVLFLNKIRRILQYSGVLSFIIVAMIATEGFASATIGYIQGNWKTPQTPQTAVTAQYKAAQVAGDLNVVVVGWNDTTATVASVSDTSGNVY